MKRQTIISTSPSETQALARSIVEKHPGRLVLALHGDLGSGKTCFVQGLAAALGIKRIVTSPTFTVINEYKGKRRLHHIDLYRLGSPDEALAIGFTDYVESDGVTAVEWAERAGDLVPHDTIHIHFAVLDGDDRRSITMEEPATKHAKPSH